MLHKRNYNTPISDEDSLVGEEQNENKTETNNPFAARHPPSRIPRLYDNPTRYRCTKFCLPLFMILLCTAYMKYEICIHLILEGSGSKINHHQMTILNL